MATTSDYPRPWIWSAVPQPKENSRKEWSSESDVDSSVNKKSDGFAVLLDQEFSYKKYKRTFSATPKLRKFSNDQSTLINYFTIVKVCISVS